MSIERADEVSHGGVVLRGHEVLVIVPRHGRTLTLPKGGAEAGEDSVVAATREVREETGIVAAPVAALGHVDYAYQRGGRKIAKRVHFHLFSPLSGNTADHDHEVREARWMPVEEAQRALSFPGERRMLDQALDKQADMGSDQLGSRT